MSEMTEQFSSDIAAVETDLPVTFIFKGKSYVGQKTQTVDIRAEADAGFIQGYDFELLARTNIFTTALPTVNDEIQILQITYRIEKATSSQDGVEITFGMVARN